VSGAALELRGLSHAYGERQVLTDVSAAIVAGQMVALLGPNGAGKSTLLRCASGVLRPSAGTVLVDGVPISEYERPTLARRLAVVPGQTVVAFPLRVAELVALGRLPHENPLLGPKAADRAAVDAAIERVGIADLRERDVRELSLGERQLAVLAMAVAQGAHLLLLDEPTVHLDLRHQVAVMELLRDLSQRDGVTILAVLHDVTLASHFFPRLVLLDAGRLVADGAPRDVLTSALIRRVYGIDPALISLPGGGHAPATRACAAGRGRAGR
jgi:iron complex transport system ATP-binding protein